VLLLWILLCKQSVAARFCWLTMLDSQVWPGSVCHDFADGLLL
jgi:hypothetical protein